MTANHVMNVTSPTLKAQYRGNLPQMCIDPGKEIKEIYRDIQKDIFIGKIEGVSFPGVIFSDDTPRIGSSVCLCGYPLPKISMTDQMVNAGNIRRYWQPTYVIDYMMFKGLRAFYTQHTSLKGMSGGPVFDVKGIVSGFDLATFTRKVPLSKTDQQVVSNGVVLDIKEIRKALNEIDFQF